MKWYNVWWPWLTFKRVAWVCQHLLSFLSLLILRQCVNMTLTRCRRESQNLINAVQNKQSIWDAYLNASEEDRDLTWKRISRVPVPQLCRHPSWGNCTYLLMLECFRLLLTAANTVPVPIHCTKIRYCLLPCCERIGLVSGLFDIVTHVTGEKTGARQVLSWLSTGLLPARTRKVIDRVFDWID